MRKTVRFLCWSVLYLLAVVTVVPATVWLGWKFIGWCRRPKATAVAEEVEEPPPPWSPTTEDLRQGVGLENGDLLRVAGLNLAADAGAFAMPVTPWLPTLTGLFAARWHLASRLQALPGPNFRVALDLLRQHLSEDGGAELDFAEAQAVLEEHVINVLNGGRNSPAERLAMVAALVLESMLTAAQEGSMAEDQLAVIVSQGASLSAAMQGVLDRTLQALAPQLKAGWRLGWNSDELPVVVDDQNRVRAVFPLALTAGGAQVFTGHVEAHAPKPLPTFRIALQVDNARLSAARSEFIQACDALPIDLNKLLVRARGELDALLPVRCASEVNCGRVRRILIRRFLQRWQRLDATPAITRARNAAWGLVACLNRIDEYNGKARVPDVAKVSARTEELAWLELATTYGLQFDLRRDGTPCLITASGEIMYVCDWAYFGAGREAFYDALGAHPARRAWLASLPAEPVNTVGCS